MVIVPVKTSDENNPVVAALYGNAEWFALVDDDKVEILANKGKGNGIETAKFLLSTGADSTLYVHLGNGPYTTLNEGHESFLSWQGRDAPEPGHGSLQKRFPSGSDPGKQQGTSGSGDAFRPVRVRLRQRLIVLQ